MTEKEIRMSFVLVGARGVTNIPLRQLFTVSHGSKRKGGLSSAVVGSRD